MAEEINHVGIAAVHGVTPVLQSSADTHVVVITTVLLDLEDKVIVAAQGPTEVLPVVRQRTAVDIDQVVTQCIAVFCAILPLHLVGTIVISAATQGQAQVVHLVVVTHIGGVTPCPEDIVARLVGIIMVVLVDPVHKVVVEAKACADQPPVINHARDETKGVITQSQSCKRIYIASSQRICQDYVQKHRSNGSLRALTRDVCWRGMLLTVALVAVVGPAVHGDVMETTALASSTEEVNHVIIADVHAVTPVSQTSADADEVVSAALQLDLGDEVIVTFQGATEVLPVVPQRAAVDIDLVVT